MLSPVKGTRGGALVALGTGLAAVALLSGWGGASAAPGGGHFNLETVTTIAPDNTTHIAAPSGDGTRLFIVGQQGRIWLFKNGTLLTTRSSTSTPSSIAAASADCSRWPLRRTTWPRGSSTSTTRLSRRPERSRSTSSGAPTPIPMLPIRRAGGTSCSSHTPGEPQRRAAPVRAGRLSLRRDGRRRRRRRPRPGRPEPGDPRRQDPPHRPARGGQRRIHDSPRQSVLQPAAEARRDLVLRLTQSLAVLVRPPDG